MRSSAEYRYADNFIGVAICESSTRRKDCGEVGGLHTIILSGWGHPAPDDWLGKPDANGSAMSRYASCDPRWATEFSAKMDTYLASQRYENAQVGMAHPVVIADYRGKNPRATAAEAVV